MKYLMLVAFLSSFTIHGARADFTTLFGEKIEDQPSVSKGTFIEPNELNPHFFYSVLESRTGTFIGVGTFRVLIDATMGNPSTVIMVDHDSRTTCFNRAHLELLKAIGKRGGTSESQRWKYVSALRNYWPSDNLDAVELSILDLILSLDDQSLLHGTYSNSKPPKEITQLLMKMKGCEIGIDPETIRPFEVLDTRLNYLDWLMHISNALGRYRSSEETPYLPDFQYYWDSDQNWQKLQNLIRNDRIVAVNMDLINIDGVRRIGNILRKNAEAVSVVDLSNMEWTAMRKKTGVDNDWFNKLHAALSTLPRIRTAAILFTFKGARPEVAPDLREKCRKDMGEYLLFDRESFKVLSPCEYTYQGRMIGWAYGVKMLQGVFHREVLAAIVNQ